MSTNREKRRRREDSGPDSVGEAVFGHRTDATKNFDLWINHGLYTFEDDGGSVKPRRQGQKRSIIIAALSNS